MSSFEALTDLAEELGELLLKNNWLMTTAESCTAGGVSHAITAINGSSAWFECGFVTYSNQSKTSLLGVLPSLIASYGAVSSEVAEAMANGALETSNANIALSITGIAGPSGGSKQKPVGTVWIAWAIKNSLCFSQLFQFDGDRNSVRYQAIEQSLLGLISTIKKNTV